MKEEDYRNLFGMLDKTWSNSLSSQTILNGNPQEEIHLHQNLYVYV